MSVISRLKLIVPALLVAGLAACGDSASTAPERTVAPVAPVAPRAAIYVTRIDTTSAVKSADITVTPGGGWFQLGKHGVYFPAYSICDPARSTYGVTEWDKWCPTITAPIKIHAEIDPAKGEWIVFTPDLRFKPSYDPNRWVYLFMYSDLAAGRYISDAEARGMFQIDWLPGNGLPAVNESLRDGTLQTRVYANTGYVYRRVKHFSGYQVALGRSLSLESATDAAAESF